MSRPPALVRPAVAALLLAVAMLLLLGLPAVSSAATDATGPGVVEGAVRDDRGTPIADASVSIQTTTRDADGTWHWDDAGARTDAQGRYRLAGIVSPDAGYDASVNVYADGYTDGTAAGVGARLTADPSTPITGIDVVLRRRDATLRGSLSVRDGGTLDGNVITATAVGSSVVGDPWRNQWSTWANADGRWQLAVPAGEYRITASSTYGLPTSWPDLSASRSDARTVTVAAGGVRGDLDISMRHRLPGPATDEYGEWQMGWDPSAASDPVGRYPRDPYRSVTVVRGAVATAGTPFSTAFNLPLRGMPDGSLPMVTGNVTALRIPITNSGDDVLWVGPVRFEDTPIDSAWCTVADGPCTDERPILPGQTKEVTVTPRITAYAPDYLVTLVAPTSAGPDLRIPLRLHNMGASYWGPDDPHNVQNVLPYLSDADRSVVEPWFGITPESKAIAATLAAWKAVASAPATAAPAVPAVKKPPALGVVTVARTSVRFTFPAAGRVDVTIDRLVRSKDERKPDRWTKARTVKLKATRAGVKSARIRRLAVGPYRVRIVARIAGRVHRVTDYRDVKP